MTLQTLIIESLKKRGHRFPDAYERITKLLEEAGELSKAIREQNNSIFYDLNLIENVQKEAADTGIVLFTIAGHFGFSLEDAIRAKLEEDKGRISE